MHLVVYCNKLQSKLSIDTEAGHTNQLQAQQHTYAGSQGSRKKGNMIPMIITFLVLVSGSGYYSISDQHFRSIFHLGVFVALHGCKMSNSLNWIKLETDT
jgi:hypothetical protein